MISPWGMRGKWVADAPVVPIEPAAARIDRVAALAEAMPLLPMTMAMPQTGSRPLAKVTGELRGKDLI
jgi:hypothetical protein